MSQTYDFDDDNGPVPAHRRTNPDGTEGGWVANTATVAGDVYVSPNATISGNADISGGTISGNADISGGTIRGGTIRGGTIWGDADISGGTISGGTIRGGTRVEGDVRIGGDRDFVTVGPLGSAGRTVTITIKPVLNIRTGCFGGSIEAFRAAVAEKHGTDSQHARDYFAMADFAEAWAKSRPQDE